MIIGTNEENIEAVTTETSSVRHLSLKAFPNHQLTSKQKAGKDNTKNEPEANKYSHTVITNLCAPIVKDI